MVLRNSLLGADLAEHVQLLLVFSAHAFFLSVRTVETREFSGSNRVFPQPAREQCATRRQLQNNTAVVLVFVTCWQSPFLIGARRRAGERENRPGKQHRVKKVIDPLNFDPGARVG
jgi:hypothetical protein